MSGLTAFLLVVAILAMVLMPLLTQSGSKTHAIALVTGLASPIVIVVAYLMTGPVSEVETEPETAMREPLESIQPKRIDSVATMAKRLHERLINHADDSDGWLLLAKSYDHMGELDAAASARQKALELTGKDDESTTESAAIEVFGTISVAPGIADQVNASDTLYVFARAANGPPMPLAARRYSAAQLPVRFVLNDSHSLSPPRRLSGENNIVVGASISRTGDAMAASTTLKGYSTAFSPQDGIATDIVIGESGRHD